MLVRVSKEQIGEKGPTLTTYLSLPGRGVVLMPSLADRIRVSSKIDKPSRRDRMRRSVQDLDPPKGMGYILRTASDLALQRDPSTVHLDQAPSGRQGAPRRW